MTTETGSGQMVRALSWKGAFWVAAGVPPLVLFSIGGIAATVGQYAFVVWMLSMLMGFSQSFTYAEMAGMFGNKSGGTSVYGATAWLRYSKLIAPLSVWCNWFAWSPVLSLGLCHRGGLYPERAVPDSAGRKPAGAGLDRRQYRQLHGRDRLVSRNTWPKMPAPRPKPPFRPSPRPMASPR